MFKTSLLFAVTLAGAQVSAMGGDAAYTMSIEKWRADRVERLRAPDGWLSLVGLEWLKPGSNRIGSGKDNDIVLGGGPAHLGQVQVADGKVVIELAADSGATIDGKSQQRAELLDDAQPAPTLVDVGSIRFYLVERSGKLGLRIKDARAKTRVDFAGIDSYAIDPGWRIEATWVPFDPPHTLEIPNVTGVIDHLPVPGKAVFERDGKTWELLPVIDDPDEKQLFFIFADRSSGKDTYGGGRFLYAQPPQDGKVVLDFNKAYNPPCAFTAFATCPLAPPENRLGVTVNAGEKKYRGAGH